MNLRQTIAKQQENWIAALDGRHLRAMDCEFCNYATRDGAFDCSVCPVVKVLGVKFLKGSILGACHNLPSWSRWRDEEVGTKRKGKAARLVLDDVNRIARHYHYPVREP